MLVAVAVAFGIARGFEAFCQLHVRNEVAAKTTQPKHFGSVWLIPSLVAKTFDVPDSVDDRVMQPSPRETKPSASSVRCLGGAHASIPVPPEAAWEDGRTVEHLR